jgi:UDPglucose--hexose-1-phosphate uridylyltransferase
MLKTATEMIYRLVDFAQAKGLIYPIDRAYHVNRLLELMQMTEPEQIEYEKSDMPETATGYLNTLADCAIRLNIIGKSNESRDLFSARVMGALTPSPAEVREKFAKYYSQSPEAATKWFYGLCRDSDYIKVDRIAKNQRFIEDSPCGKLEITINLSKPEKDPRDIAAQRVMPQAGYPRCMLCVENPGYAGRIGFPARQNHRMIPLNLDSSQWYLQYSPYLYYNEHCIVLNSEHVPMHIDRSTFVRLFDFVSQFPHYFLGSNADLPIVGGSILAHDHFQGGNYRFPMDNAPDRFRLECPVAGVEAAIVDWPMTCIRLRGDDRDAITDAAEMILNAWRGYSDPERGIFAESGNTPHNTITPILRMEDGRWKLDLVLRNNITTIDHPLGVFHPHDDLHHIKKENIGLIEVMGLFILPGRLVREFDELSKYLTGEIATDEIPRGESPLRKHYTWINQIARVVGTELSHEAAMDAIHKALSDKCARVLADCGVFKDDAGIEKFMATMGFKRA